MDTRVTLGGAPIGRFKAGWRLFTECWRFMMLDREMLFVPVIAFIVELMLIGLAVLGFVYSGGIAEVEAHEQGEGGIVLYGLLFVWYVLSAIVVTFSQAVIAHIVHTRSLNGDATLKDGFRKARSVGTKLILWSIITSTVGIILRILSDRSALLGKIVAGILGGVWAILTYFTVPSIVIGGHAPGNAIKDSAYVFKKTWGETLVANISYTFVFMLAFILVIVLAFGLVVVTNASSLGIVIACVVMVSLVVLISLVSSVMSSILRTLLYIYASTGTLPENFDGELLTKILARDNTSPSSSTMGSTTV